MKKIQTLIALIAMLAIVTSAQALEPTVVTFDYGVEGWDADPDCTTVHDDGGNPGAFMNFANHDCEGTWYLRAYYDVRTGTNPAFVGDYTAKGPVRVSVDVNVNAYDYFIWWSGSMMPVEAYRVLVAEFIDWDNPYTDPDTGYSWPWTSVMYNMGYFQDRGAGWKTFTVDIEDPNATELPDGWIGFGGPENPSTYMSQLPPDRTFADVMAEVDEIVFHTIEPGYYYSIGFLHDMDFDNITIMELPRECEGQLATVYVDNDGIVRGGEYDGLPYAGDLVGTQGDDVIVGTMGDDNLQGLGGHDLMCGKAGNDSMHGNHGDDILFGDEGDDVLTGQLGNDFLSGGEGRDVMNGGPGDDTCINGEIANQCADGGAIPTSPRVRPTSAAADSGTQPSSVSFGQTTSTTEPVDPGDSVQRIAVPRMLNTRVEKSR